MAETPDPPMSPTLLIDLDRIEHNARTVSALCRRHGIAVTGVTKGVCGHPDVAQAMMRGGVGEIGDSRFRNIARLRRAGIAAPVMQLRLPPLSGADRVVAQADVSLNSEPAVLVALSDHALRLARVHDVILMVDLGDRREGVMPGELTDLVTAARGLRGLRIAGVGTNFACLYGAMPTRDSLERLVDLAARTERRLGRPLRWVSGLNSSGLDLLASGAVPGGINHARIGEAILLGREALHRNAWPGTFQDAFTLEAEILEIKAKPTAPTGLRGPDAFGGHPAIVDRGRRLRALLNIGREDTSVGTLTPTEPGVSVLGTSSGYLVADVGDAGRRLQVGDALRFWPDYGALLAAMTSEYVAKRPIRAAGGG